MTNLANTLTFAVEYQDVRPDMEVLRMLWLFHFAQTHQLARLVFGKGSKHYRERMNATVSRLYDDDLIWREPRRIIEGNRSHYKGKSSSGFYYGLTKDGKNFLKDSADKYMPEILQSHGMTREFYLSTAGRKSIRHSGNYTEFCTRFIEETRRHPITRGIFFDTECVLLGSHLRMDGLLRFRFLRRNPGVIDTSVRAPWYVPWMSHLRYARHPDMMDRTFAIEIDEGTEELEIIYRKALNYQRTFYGGMNVEGYTPVAWDAVLCPQGEVLPDAAKKPYFPTPVFIVPGSQRLINLWTAWCAGWKDAELRITDWGLLDMAETVVNAPYYNQDGKWVNLLGRPHAYDGTLPKPTGSI